jgi:hypothetical protein
VSQTKPSSERTKVLKKTPWTRNRSFSVLTQQSNIHRGGTCKVLYGAGGVVGTARCVVGSPPPCARSARSSAMSRNPSLTDRTDCQWSTAAARQERLRPCSSEANVMYGTVPRRYLTGNDPIDRARSAWCSDTILRAAAHWRLANHKGSPGVREPRWPHFREWTTVHARRYSVGPVRG